MNYDKSKRYLTVKILKSIMLASSTAHSKPSRTQDGYLFFKRRKSLKGKTFLVGFAGPSGSGKSTAMRRVMEGVINATGPDKVAVINADSYYVGVPEATAMDHDFDSPDAIEWSLLIEHLEALLSGKSIECPVYCFVTHQRLKSTRTIHPAPVIMVDGILILHIEALRKMFDLRFFVDVDLDECFIRRLERDMRERGRNLDSTIHQWRRFVRPGYYNYVLPTRRYADLVIMRGGDNTEAIATAIDRVLAHIKNGDMH